MEQKQKKPYHKPMIVFEDFRTGELAGSPEMIAQIQADCTRMEAEHPVQPCPFDGMGMPCHPTGN